METDVLERPNAIAVIGMSGRFPGANSLDSFWRNLVDGVESITFFTDEELLAAGVAPDLIANPDYVKASPLLSDIDLFDARLFKMSPREAELTDPEHRIFLETAWNALEHSGYAGDYPGAIGVFAGAGCSMNSYFASEYHVRHKLIGASGGREHIANDKDYLATRVSYKLNLRGPSFTVQCACSTSMAAVHLACQSLLSGESDIALAGGVSVRVPQQVGYLKKDNVVSSPDGHCRTFDANAQGTIFGSGVGVVILKPLDTAMADGDTIHAVIRGSAMNNDGAEKISYWASSAEGQIPAMKEALALSGAPAETIRYVEAHGTGTSMGDPVEVFALTRAFHGGGAKEPRQCVIGSIKPNIGHLDSASGVASLIKTILVLKNRTIPPSILFETPNPRIDFEKGPFRVVTEQTPWPDADLPARAAINSLGIGGTNVFAVLEEAPKVTPVRPTQERTAQLLTLSARTQKALVALAARYADYFRQCDEVALADTCFTANAGRMGLPFRMAMTVGSCEEAARRLDDFANDSPDDGVIRGKAGSTLRLKNALLFGDASPLPLGIGQQLYATNSSFAQTIDSIDSLIDDGSLVEYTFGPGAPSESNNPTLDALSNFALQYGMARQLGLWDVEPTVVVGSGLGLIAAAASVGAFRMQDAVRLVLAASKAKIDHSPEAIDRLNELCRSIVMLPPRGPVIVLDNGMSATEEIADPQFWIETLAPGDTLANVEATAAAMKERRINILWDCGHVTPFGEQLREQIDSKNCHYMPCLMGEPDDWRIILHSFGRLSVLGAAIDRTRLDEGYSRHRIPVPTYPFQKKSYWIESLPEDTSGAVPLAPAAQTDAHPLLGPRLELASDQVIFQSTLRSRTPAFMEQCQRKENSLVPIGSIVDIACAAANEIGSESFWSIRDLEYSSPISIPEGEPQTIQTVIGNASVAGVRQLQIFRRIAAEDALDDVTWEPVARARIVHGDGGNDFEEILEGIAVTPLNETLDAEAVISLLDGAKVKYGPHFQRIQSLSVSDDNRYASIAINSPEHPPGEDHSRCLIHPTVVQAALQGLQALFARAEKTGQSSQVDSQQLTIAELESYAPCDAAEMRWLIALDAQAAKADLFLVATEGPLLARMKISLPAPE